MRSVRAVSSLAEVVRNRMDVLGIDSGRELSRRCGLGKDTAMSVLAGRRLSPSEATLQKLANGLALPIQQLRLAAGRPRGERTPFVVPTAWDGLTLPQRDLLYRTAAALLQVGDSNQDGSDTVGYVPTLGGRQRFAARYDHPDGAHVNPVFRDAP